MRRYRTAQPGSRSKKRRLCRRFLLAGAAAAAAASAAWVFLFTGLFEIRELRLHGGRHLAVASLRDKVAAYRGANVFLVPLGDIRRLLMDDPAVGTVTFRRRLPHGLDCYLHERQPAALISLGEMAEVDAEGVVIPAGFHATQIDLPVITGLRREELNGPGRGKIMRALEVLSLLGRFGFSPAEQLSEIHFDGEEISLVLMGEGTFVRVGSEEFEERIRKFRAVYPALVEQGRLPAEVDLRFDRQVVVR
ncbi:MAG: cell division protein FtsQ/DivIB [Candidatus Krumholzibacteria bacterium]|nr:cell division protein FtsQ/DivIB [Candidatus Krumholzibacteria bacterium]